MYAVVGVGVARLRPVTHGAATVASYTPGPAPLVVSLRCCPLVRRQVAAQRVQSEAEAALDGAEGDAPFEGRLAILPLCYLPGRGG